MLENARNITVDVKNLNFYSIELSQNGSRQSLMSSSIDNSTNRLVIIPILFLKSGLTYELTFIYSGLVNPTAGGDTGGLFFTTFEDANEKTR